MQEDATITEKIKSGKRRTTGVPYIECITPFIVLLYVHYVLSLNDMYWLYIHQM